MLVCVTVYAARLCGQRPGFDARPRPLARTCTGCRYYTAFTTTTFLAYCYLKYPVLLRQYLDGRTVGVSFEFECCFYRKKKKTQRIRRYLYYELTKTMIYLIQASCTDVLGILIRLLIPLKV